MSKHNEFIQKPITVVLEEGVSSCSGVGDGIETYPLSDYIMQSIFLKMTGFQEQKLKCINWEIATDNFEYRRRFIKNEDKFGEYSTYKDKNTVFKRLYEQFERLDPLYKVEDKVSKKDLIDRTIASIKEAFEGTNLMTWAQKEYDYFCNNYIVGKDKFDGEAKNNLGKKKDGKVPDLFGDGLKNRYESLYLQRNRLAHNTISYQQNLPDLGKLRAENEGDRNYFIWFAMLILIDNIFISMYEEYKQLLEETIY